MIECMCGRVPMPSSQPDRGSKYMMAKPASWPALGGPGSGWHGLLAVGFLARYVGSPPRISVRKWFVFRTLN